MRRPKNTEIAYIVPHPLGGYTIQAGQLPCVGRWMDIATAAQEAHKRYNIVLQCSINEAFPTQPTPVLLS